MPVARSNFHIKRGHKATSRHPNQQKVMHKSSSSGVTIPENMAARTTPVELGTRGTVGSLIMREIEYFSQHELGCQDSSEKARHQFTDTASTSGNSRPKTGSSSAATPKKKKRGGSKFIPSMCSVVEVTESSQPNTIPGFSYRNLKADAKKLQA